MVLWVGVVGMGEGTEGGVVVEVGEMGSTRGGETDGGGQ